MCTIQIGFPIVMFSIAEKLRLTKKSIFWSSRLEHVLQNGDIQYGKNVLRRDFTKLTHTAVELRQVFEPLK